MTIDFSTIPTRQDAIHLRLEEWAKWVQVHPAGWQTQPMFRQYRSHAWQWETPTVPTPVNTLAAHEMERAVYFLPEKHRAAIRWAYVYPFISDSRVRRDIAVTRKELASLLVDGRDMLINRLKITMQEQ